MRTGGDRPQRGATLPGLMVVIALIVGVFLLDPTSSGQRLREIVGLDERVEEAVRIPDGEGSYAFSATQPDSERPVSWNPCRPIEYVVNPDGAPDDWADLVSESIEVIGAATGFAFEDGGSTDDREFERRTNGLGRAGPVLIGWADADEVPALAGEVAGVGGSAYVERSGQRRFITGSVALDSDVYDALGERRDGREQMRAILLHELGHVVGLGHVDDTGELMTERGLARTDFGPGDLEGLARLGAVKCG